VAFPSDHPMIDRRAFVTGLGAVLAARLTVDVTLLHQPHHT